MKDAFASILRQLGDEAAIREVTPVSGGSINRVYRVTTAANAYLVKIHPRPPAHFFAREAEGLELIRRTQTIRVPQVYGYGTMPGQSGGFIVLEWIQGSMRADTAAKLGRSLALMHQSFGSCFGLTDDNYIGLLPQKNERAADWLSFYRECRLRFLAAMAFERGFMPRERGQRMDKLLASLDRWIPADCRPSLLHGDLWGGNWIAGENGEPYLIDPAVFYGHWEMDIAFSELFGGFSRQFYDAYREVNPLPPEYEERRPLYQLYYLLVHLLLFGESYGPQVDRILRRYT
jgi:fructosamine-3-kinase